MSSNELCKACTLLEGLERGIAAMAIVSFAAILTGKNQILTGVGQTDKARKKLDAAEGGANDNMRTIPYFQLPVHSKAGPNSKPG